MISEQLSNKPRRNICLLFTSRTSVHCDVEMQAGVRTDLGCTFMFVPQDGAVSQGDLYLAGKSIAASGGNAAKINE